MSCFDKLPNDMEEQHRTDKPAQTAIGMYSAKRHASELYPVFDESVKISAADYARKIGETFEPVNNVAQCIVQEKIFQPIEYKVVIRPDLIEETDESIKRFKALGMELPDAEKEREKHKQITGILISIGGNAFSDMREPLPKIGDKVYFAKHAGLVLKADDGTEHRLMNDKDITAVLV